ncbi:conserved protein of unknown function [Pseudomonas marincola]|uniref:Uncharacterized protein n=2 Tax=Pseudomonas marincola TaxID=437900 RepID=A0A653E4J3_9PSED|nr:conserved protein of unknown function [Pseudomonas marincola]
MAAFRLALLLRRMFNRYDGLPCGLTILRQPVPVDGDGIIIWPA